MTRTLILPFAASFLLAAACDDATAPAAPDDLRPTLGVQLEVPEEHPGNPFYSPIHRNPGSFLFPRTEAWGAAPFERQLSCVPPDFNLLTLFDFTPAFPGGPPRVFRCTLTVEGFNVWENGPAPVDPGPVMVQSRGLGAVPVVVARWNEIEAAMSDGVLTLPELLDLPSAMVGVADTYVANYVNGPLPLGFVMHKIVASGTLPNGRSFRVHVNSTCLELPCAEGEVRYQIDIR